MEMVVPCISLTILILYCLLSTVTFADIQLGSILQPTIKNTTTWNSPNNTSSLGFIPIHSAFAVAISFSGIPIWKAGDDTTLVDSNSRFEFLRNGNLHLINGSGGVLWQSDTANLGVTIATLDDSGNLSLKNGSNITIWSTFDNPTDTIVPTQIFTTDKTLRSGSFSFNLLKSGNLTLRWNTDPIYWNQGLNSSINPNLTAPSLGLLSTGILQLYDLTLPIPIVIAFSSDYGDVDNIFRFLRLDSDGNLRIYSSDLGSGNSTERWSAVPDQCLVYGWCGNMGICSFNQLGKPTCGCPSQNFEFLDPNNTRKGCKRKVEISNCSDLTMMQLDNTRFLTYQPEISYQLYSSAISGCRSNCQVDGTCIASTSLADGTGFCYLKTTNFVSGYYSPVHSGTSFVKVCGPVLPNPSPSALDTTPITKTFKLRKWVIAVIVLVTVLSFVLVEGGLRIYGQ